MLTLILVSGQPTAASEVLPQLEPFIKVPVPRPQDFTASVHRGHPRLLLTPRRQEEIRTLREASPVARAWYRSVQANAQYYQALPPIAYVPEKPGERAQEIPMVHPSRALADRIYTLGLVGVLDGDEPAIARLRRELMHALDDWPDWQYGLARYEIAAGVAIAYDWLHSRWTPAERAKISAALRRLALEPYAREFAGFAKPSARNEGIVRNNVNLVCNAGASVAALAVLDEYPEVAGEVLSMAFSLLQVALPGFGEDGAWNEGVSYWKFGVRHLVQYLACLDSACRTDFGLVSTHRFPGFERTSTFPLAMTSPSGHAYNFADDGGGVFSSAALLWLGAAFRSPLAIAHEERATTGLAFAGDGRNPNREMAREVVQRLLYYQPQPPGAAAGIPPLDLLYPHAGIATLRSSWTDPRATFVGLKAGSAAGNRHAHLDAGSVVIDALGERWLSEMGRGPNITRYFNEDRYLFFQARTEGHNTLLVDPDQTRGGNQRIAGKATIREFRASPEEVSCTVDLTDAYAGATRVERAVRLFSNRRQVGIADAVELPQAGVVRWHAYTQAPVIIASRDGRILTLKFAGNTNPNAGKRLALAIVSADPSQRFVVEPAAPLPGSEATNRDVIKGFSRLAIASGSARAHRIAVELVPADDGP